MFKAIGTLWRWLAGAGDVVQDATSAWKLYEKIGLGGVLELILAFALLLLLFYGLLKVLKMLISPLGVICLFVVIVALVIIAYANGWYYWG